MDLTLNPPENDPLAVAPAEDFAYRPPAVADVADPGFLQGTANEWLLGPSVQAIARAVEWLQPTEEGFDPLKQPEIVGREEWAPWLREAKSRREFDMMLARYQDNQGRQQVQGVHGTLWQSLAAGILAPENFLIPGLAPSRSVLGGLAKGAVYGAATQAPLTAIGQAVDPTATRGHELEELFYAGVAGGIFGGIAGGLSGLGDAFHAHVGGFAKRLATEQRGLDAQLVPMVGEDGVARPQATAPQAYRAEATPEGASPRGDIAPAFGLEAVVSKGGILNPLQTAWGVLVGSPYRALQDFAQQMGGDFSLLLRRNIEEGKATPVSAWLLSGRHLAQAAEVERQLQREYAAYLGKPAPAEVGGINVTTTGARLGGLVRSVAKRPRADGKLEYHEWLEAIFDAHKKDRIEVDLTRHADQSPDAAASVMKGVEVVRGYFDAADREGSGLDFLPSKEGSKRILERRFRRFDQTMARLAELNAKDQASLTVWEQAERIVLAEAAERQKGRIPEKVFLAREYDRLIDTWVKAHEEGRTRDTDPFLQAVHERMVELESQGVGQRRVQSAGGPTKTVSNPRTNEVPPGGEAANVGLSAANDPDPRPAAEPIDFGFKPYGTDGVQAISGNDNFKTDLTLQDPGPARREHLHRFGERLLEMDEKELAALYDDLYDEMVASGQQVVHASDEMMLTEFVLGEREIGGAITLEDLRPLIEGADDGATKLYVAGKDGAPIAEVRVQYKENAPIGHQGIDRGNLVWVEWIGALDENGKSKGVGRHAENQFDKQFTLDVGRLLKQQFPEATHIGGYRIGGARRDDPAPAFAKVPQHPKGRVNLPGRELEGIGSMPRPVNDNRVEAALLEHPIEARNPEGLLPDHERLTADNLNDELGGPDSDPFYLTRRWDHERVRADEAGLRAAFERWHHDEGKPPLTEEQWTAIRDGILAGPKAREDGGRPPVGGTFRLGRKLDIPNEYVRDYVERNVSNLIREYAHRFGAGLEVHRIFGDRDAEDAMTDALVQMIREHKGGSLEAILKDVDRNRGAMRYVRDQVLGDLHVDDPLTLSKVGAEALKAWASTTMLGKVVFSTLPELVRPLMTHGFMRTFRFLTDNVIGNVSGFEHASRDLRLRVGEAIDVAMGLSGRRLMEFGDLTRPGSTLAHKTRAALDPFLNFANGPWYIMNGLGPITDLTKNYVMTMSSHYLIEDMRRLVAGRASQKTTERLLSFSIDRDFAEVVLREPLERSGKLNVANLGAWQDQAAANRFAAAVRGDVNRVIATASPQSKSAISQGFLRYDSGRRQWAMVTLPFQFMHWGLSAAQKISMSALQGRDANAMGGMAALIGMAYFASWLKSDERAWEKTPLEERVFRAVDNSGVLSIAGNLNNLVETGSQGTFGMRPAFGMEQPFARDPVGAAGPVAGKLSEIYRSFTDPEVEDYQAAATLRRSIPTNNLIYTDALWKGVQRSLMDPDE